MEATVQGEQGGGVGGQAPGLRGWFGLDRRVWSAALLAALIAASVGLRVAYLVHTRLPSHPTTVPAEMERAAISLARDGTFARIYSDETGPSAHVAPLYPLWLGALYRMFGWDTAAGRWAQALSAVIATTAGLVLLPVVARRTGLSVGAGWAAAFTLAVLPINLWIESAGAWEQPYSAVALAALILLFCRLGDGGWRSPAALALTGVVSGIVALLSPTLLPAIPLMAAGEWFMHQGERGRVVDGTLVIAVAAGLVIAPWAVRNYYALGGFVPLRSNLGLELALGNRSGATGKLFATSWDDPDSPLYRLHPFSSAEERAELTSLGELAYMKSRRDRALAWMKAHPAEALRLTLTRFRLYWLPGKDSWAPTAPLRGFKSAFACLIALGAFGGLGSLAVQGRGRAWLLAAALIGPSLAYMITHVDPRYRYPTSAISTLLAFDLVADLGRRLAGRLRLGGGRPASGLAPLQGPEQGESRPEVE